MAALQTITRSPGGFVNRNIGHMFEDMFDTDPMFHHDYINDFDVSNAGDFTVTKVGTGTNVLTNGDGGRLLITNSAANGDSVTYTTATATYRMLSSVTSGVAPRRTFFSAKFQSNDMTNTLIRVGLINLTTTPFTATDGVFIDKPNGSANFVGTCRVGSVSTSSGTIATGANNTDLTLQLAYNGYDKATFGVNGVPQVIVGGAGAAIVPTTVDMCLVFVVQNGAAVAKTMNIDYIFARQERG